MAIEKMSFKGFVWPQNPEKINVFCTKNQKELKILNKSVKIQDFGNEKMTISGSGQFFGPNFIKNFEKLNQIFQDPSPGVLRLPGFEPFIVVFHSLSMCGEATPEFLNYSFEFWQVILDEKTKKSQKKLHKVAQNETLWSIANSEKTSIDSIVALNSFIKNPNELKEGQELTIL